MKQISLIFSMILLLSVGSGVCAVEVNPPIEVDSMAALIDTKSTWVWHTNEQVLMICFKIDNVNEALCTAVPPRYRVTDIQSSQPTLVIPYGSDIQM